MWSLNRQSHGKSVKIYRGQTPQNLLKFDKNILSFTFCGVCGVFNNLALQLPFQTQNSVSSVSSLEI